MTQRLNKARLRWGCRRGMWELDILLLRFFDSHFEKLSNEQKQRFGLLLECQDPDLFAWLMNYSESPQEFKDLIALIQNLDDSALIMAN